MIRAGCRGRKQTQFQNEWWATADSQTSLNDATRSVGICEHNACEHQSLFFASVFDSDSGVERCDTTKSRI